MITKNFHANNSRDTTTLVTPIVISAAAMYFITILTLLCIKPTDGSWVAQLADQWIKQKGTVDSEDEVMAPSIPAVIIGE